MSAKENYIEVQLFKLRNDAKKYELTQNRQQTQVSSRVNLLFNAINYNNPSVVNSH